MDDVLDASTAAKALSALGALLRHKPWIKDLEVGCLVSSFQSCWPAEASVMTTASGGSSKRLTNRRGLQVIKARVPIVRLLVMPWGLKFDISVADTSSSGLRAAKYIQEQLQLWPPLKPLVTILKLFLLQRNMNEVYTGGLGSFALILSVVAFLKMHPSRLPRPGLLLPLLFSPALQCQPSRILGNPLPVTTLCIQQPLLRVQARAPGLCTYTHKASAV